MQADATILYIEGISASAYSADNPSGQLVLFPGGVILIICALSRLQVLLIHNPTAINI